jgi:UDP-N-acetylmuramate dehydrogenase
VLQSAKVLLADGEVKEVGVDFFQFGYDDSILHHREIIVLEAVFALESKPIDEIERTMAANLAWRAEKHPSEPSCGSVFKKIEGIGAGRLIDEAGLKGHRIGGAQVSSKHANFIVNLGGATASDVYGLIKLVQQRVEEKSGYRLEIEIRLVGEF